MSNEIIQDVLYERVSALIMTARSQVRTVVNQAMVQTYWQIGRFIVEDEQAGKNQAEYGTSLLKELSGRLTSEFGKGFDARNLRNMRQFYLLFPNWYAVRTNLNWTHYRSLLKIENEVVRNWYMAEADMEGWSTRALERQINSFYYERLLSSQDKKSVVAEANENTAELSPRDILKDPYVLEFLELGERSSFTESRVIV
jgi:DUF1016 N-terminal domain